MKICPQRFQAIQNSYVYRYMLLFSVLYKLYYSRFIQLPVYFSNLFYYFIMYTGSRMVNVNTLKSQLTLINAYSVLLFYHLAT